MKMARHFLKRLGLMVLSMAVISGVMLLTYAYVAPFIFTGGANVIVDQGGELVGNGLESIDGVMGGALSSTTNKITGSGAPDEPRPEKPHTTPGTVSRVIDGDTLVVGGKTMRLALVNTPERGEPGYSEAKEFTKGECPRGSIAHYKVDSGQPVGSYGRMIAKVWCGDTSSPSLNELLMESGHAEILTNFCAKSEFGGDQWAGACESGNNIQAEEARQDTNAPAESPAARTDARPPFQVNETPIIVAIMAGIMVIIMALLLKRRHKGQPALNPASTGASTKSSEDGSNQTVQSQKPESAPPIPPVPGIKECAIVLDTNVWIHYFEEKGEIEPTTDEPTTDESSSDGIESMIQDMSDSKSLYLVPAVRRELFSVIKNRDEEKANVCVEAAKKLDVSKGEKRMVSSENLLFRESLDIVKFFERTFEENRGWRRSIQRKHWKNLGKEDESGLWTPNYTWEECDEDLSTDMLILTSAKTLQDADGKARIMITEDNDFWYIRNEIFAKFNVWVLKPEEWKEATSSNSA